MQKSICFSSAIVTSKWLNNYAKIVLLIVKIFLVHCDDYLHTVHAYALDRQFQLLVGKFSGVVLPLQCQYKVKLNSSKYHQFAILSFSTRAFTALLLNFTVRLEHGESQKVCLRYSCLKVFIWLHMIYWSHADLLVKKGALL